MTDRVPTLAALGAAFLLGVALLLAGYDGQHAMPDDWTVVEWQAAGGYGLIGDDEAGTGRANRHRERLWLSPHCVRARQGSLFDGVEAVG